METLTKVLMSILFVSGSLVSTICFYVSTFINTFFGTAIIVITIVVITVFVVVVYDIYDRYTEKE